MYKLIVETSSNLRRMCAGRSLPHGRKHLHPIDRPRIAVMLICMRRPVPICQDTGMPTFEIMVPPGANQLR
jgi:hypothetical protein